MTNLIFVSLLLKKGIYCRFNYFTIQKMHDQSEVVINKLIGNLFIFFINELYKFALLSEI